LNTRSTSAGGDRLYRFLFEALDLRGELVRLDAGWQAALARNTYPPEIATLLGEGLASAVLLSATIKFEGSLILQLQSDGRLSSLVAQATHERTFRGIARWREGDEATPALAGGHLALTIIPKAGNRVQGIVSLPSAGLTAALEEYFARSEQLPTRLWLAADGNSAAGLLLQALPGKHGDAEDWERIVTLAETVTPGEMLNLPPEQLLYRLFHQEQVRLFDPEPVSFRCSCSRERIADTLRGLGRHEVEDILREHGLVEATCEFCGHHYAFDTVDVAELFTEGAIHGDPTRLQ